jgi:hypothetical protein
MKRASYLILIFILLLYGCGSTGHIDDIVNVGKRFADDAFKPAVKRASGALDDTFRQGPRTFTPITKLASLQVETDLRYLDIEENTIQRLVRSLEEGQRDENAIRNLTEELAQDSTCEVLLIGVQTGGLPTEKDRDKILHNRIEGLPYSLLKAFGLVNKQFSFRKDLQESMNKLERDIGTTDTEYSKQVYSVIFEQSCKLLPVR